MAFRAIDNIVAELFFIAITLCDKTGIIYCYYADGEYNIRRMNNCHEFVKYQQEY